MDQPDSGVRAVVVEADRLATSTQVTVVFRYWTMAISRQSGAGSFGNHRAGHLSSTNNPYVDAQIRAARARYGVS
jgi:hypothetical protein